MKTPEPKILKVAFPHQIKEREKVLIQESCCGDKKLITRKGLKRRKNQGDWRCAKCVRTSDDGLKLGQSSRDYGIVSPDWPVPPMVLRNE